MTVALIVAAGSGERLGAGRPKALVELGGRPLLQWSIDAIAALPGLQRIVVAMPEGSPAPEGVTAVTGGACRSESVALALAAAGEGETVLVHDAARPLVSTRLLKDTIAALAADESADAAIAASPVKDTIKRVDEAGAVVETLDRSSLWAVQTPQVFRRAAARARAGRLSAGAGSRHRRRMAHRAGRREGDHRRGRGCEPEGHDPG